MNQKAVYSYILAVAALMVAVFLAYTGATMVLIQPEIVPYTSFREVGGNTGYQTGLGFLALLAGVVSVTAMGFGFHASRD